MNEEMIYANGLAGHKGKQLNSISRNGCSVYRSGAKLAAAVRKRSTKCAGVCAKEECDSHLDTR